MAHKKAAGSSKNGRDSIGKRLGVKEFGGMAVTQGSIIVRQRGTVYHTGTGVSMGRDQSIYASMDGVVQFGQKRIRKYDGRSYKVTTVNVVASQN